MKILTSAPVIMAGVTSIVRTTMEDIIASATPVSTWLRMDTNAKILMNVRRTLIIATRMPLVPILLAVLLVFVTLGLKEMVPPATISMNVPRGLITAASVKPASIILVVTIVIDTLGTCRKCNLWKPCLPHQPHFRNGIGVKIT